MNVSRRALVGGALAALLPYPAFALPGLWVQHNDIVKDIVFRIWRNRMNEMNLLIQLEQKALRERGLIHKRSFGGVRTWGPKDHPGLFAEFIWADSPTGTFQVTQVQCAPGWPMYTPDLLVMSSDHTTGREKALLAYCLDPHTLTIKWRQMTNANGKVVWNDSTPNI